MDIYDNLAIQLKEKISNKQFWSGISGGPGAGKSTKSENLANIMNNKYKIKTLIIPMDGFHYSKEYLLSKDENNFLFLKKRGSPMSLDVESFCSKLIKAKKWNKPIYFPSFSRIIDDPIINDIEYNPSFQLIIVEGNYLSIGNLTKHLKKNILNVKNGKY
jgi:pantothenate kinase